MQHFLFLCSRNRWRSRTAATIFRNDDRFQVRSAGTAAGARIPLTGSTVSWADVVFVMERKHRDHLRRRFAAELGETPVVVLDIPDEYQYMDRELVEELRDAVETYLAEE